MQRLGRACQVAKLRNGDEGAQLIEIQWLFGSDLRSPERHGILQRNIK
jgi:hypothetical protein